MYPHRIRLRGPWEFEVLPGARVPDSAPLSGRVAMPCTLSDAGFAMFSGSIRFSRHFGMPRVHHPQEHYWLVFDAESESLHVVLNDRDLADFAGSGRFKMEVTDFLKERNLLHVTLHTTDFRHGLSGETALEIRRAAYLENARVARLPDGRLRATLELAGELPEGLELYLLADRRTLAYGRVSRTGSPVIEMLSDEAVAPETSVARLELVAGGLVWFQANCEID